MNRNHLAVAAALLFTAGTASSVTAQGSSGASVAPKFAYIDSRKILEQAPGRPAIEAQYRKEMVPVEARIKSIRDSAATVFAAFQKDGPTMAADARAKRQKDLEDKQAKWEAESDSLARWAQARGAALEQPMMDLLRKILSDIRAEESYWLIVDVAAQGGLGIVAIDKNLEITDRVLDRFKVASASLPKPGDSKPGDAPKPAAGGATGPANTTTGVGRIIPPGW